jgi:hypothetical protein
VKSEILRYFNNIVFNFFICQKTSLLTFTGALAALCATTTLASPVKVVSASVTHPNTSTSTNTLNVVSIIFLKSFWFGNICF